MKYILLPLLLAVSTFASAVTINNPTNGSTVTSPFVISGSSATCSGQPVVQIGYSIDSGTDVLSPQAQTLHLTATASPGEHTVHVEVRGKSGSACETDVEITVSGATPAASGTTYYLSPTGSDSNSGLSPSSAWASPAHALNCGDVILAESGTYQDKNFGGMQWGKVTCSGGNNVAWLKCATFDTCKINAPTGSNAVMGVNASYWGVEGWEVTAPSGQRACFAATPNGEFSTIHHIIFADDIANVCSIAGFSAEWAGRVGTGTDYVAFVGDIAYNTTKATESAGCGSGLSIGDPEASDSAAGTHMFVAGNFSWANVPQDPCNGGVPTDGNGVIFDHWATNSYTQQGVAENNLVFFNGGRGFEKNQGAAPLYLVHNTLYDDDTDKSQTSDCEELQMYSAAKINVYDNLVGTSGSTGCDGLPLYAVAVELGGANNQVYDNWLYSDAGHNFDVLSSPGFEVGAGNVTGTSPSLAHPVNPGAPHCSGYASTTACMATVIADYKPTNSSAKSYGYQTPSSTPDSDPLFPQWLCNVNLPSGLVTEGCAK